MVYTEKGCLKKLMQQLIKSLCLPHEYDIQTIKH